MIRSADGEMMRINFNVSFPALSCEFASVDVGDAMGLNRFHLTKTVFKRAIDNDLNPLGPIQWERGHENRKEIGHADDEATAALMTSFYTRLKEGMGRGDALAATQREFRSHPNEEWREPYVWAAFQLSGDWRPIEGL